ncbi:MAG: hypothetical protein IKH62_05680, partial [Methanobrevibacter sp.]|nr:hypothetical protein [Methanobrevibacter sp.]
MELLCIQSQEHPELPLAELKAVMECEDIDAEIEKVTEGLVILKDIPNDKLDEYYVVGVGTPLRYLQRVEFQGVNLCHVRFLGMLRRVRRG